MAVTFTHVTINPPPPSPVEMQVAAVKPLPSGNLQLTVHGTNGHISMELDATDAARIIEQLSTSATQQS